MVEVLGLIGSRADVIALLLILEARVRVLRDVRNRLQDVERAAAATARATDGVRDKLVERELSVDPDDVDPLVDDPPMRADGGPSKRLDRFFSARGFATVVAGLGAGKVIEVGIAVMYLDPVAPFYQAASWFGVFLAGVAMIAAWPKIERRIWNGGENDT